MKNFIQHKLFSQNYANNRSTTYHNLDSGFSLIEAIASLLIGSILLGFGLNGFLSLREGLLGDVAKTNVNQRLRTIFATVGPDIQQIGEGVRQAGNFPAVSISQRTLPSGNVTSDITIRQGDLVGTLELCRDITAGSTDNVQIINPLDGGCVVDPMDSDGLPDVVARWTGKRLNQGGTIRAFMYDVVTGNFEFFDYIGEEFRRSGTDITPAMGNVPDEINLVTNATNWVNSYSAASTTVYLIREKLYRVNDDNVLVLDINDGEEILNLAESIENINIVAKLQAEPAKKNDPPPPIYDCTILPPTSGNCSPSDPTTVYSWTQIRAVELEVVAKPPEKGGLSGGLNNQTFKPKDLTFSQEYFPRNRLNF